MRSASMLPPRARSARPKALPVGARGHSEGGKEGAAQALGRAEAAAPGDLRQGQIGLLELATRGGDADLPDVVAGRYADAVGEVPGEAALAHGDSVRQA